MLRWSSGVLDKHVAPEISTFTGADIPDLQPDFPEWRHWVTNHFLGNVFRGGFREPWRQYALNFIRRSQATFNFYQAAREVTTKYLVGNDVRNPKIGQYYEAIAAWEVVFMNWAICLDLVRRLNGEHLFQKNDGSSEQRAHAIHNTIKHHAADIHSGTLAGDDTLPVWLTSSGFRSKSDELSYAELADLVRDISKLSTELQDVRTFLKAGTNAAEDEPKT